MQRTHTLSMQSCCIHKHTTTASHLAVQFLQDLLATDADAQGPEGQQPPCLHIRRSDGPWSAVSLCHACSFMGGALPQRSANPWRGSRFEAVSEEAASASNRARTLANLHMGAHAIWRSCALAHSRTQTYSRALSRTNANSHVHSYARHHTCAHNRHTHTHTHTLAHTHTHTHVHVFT